MISCTVIFLTCLTIRNYTNCAATQWAYANSHVRRYVLITPHMQLGLSNGPWLRCTKFRCLNTRRKRKRKLELRTMQQWVVEDRMTCLKRLLHIVNDDIPCKVVVIVCRMCSATLLVQPFVTRQKEREGKRVKKRTIKYLCTTT